tara:strand:- start:5 stop:640 length:636 start_codon:yes stop_codon:yes gene_type:complete
MKEEFKEEYPHLRSDEEVYFTWYMDDLEEAGFIDHYNYEGEVYSMTEPLFLPWTKQLATKTKDMEFSALAKSTYNPDYNIYWDNSAKGIFIPGIPSKDKPYFAGSEFLDLTDQCKSTIDVKGSGSKTSSDNIFPFKQKLMWLTHNIYVHKVIPQQLFKKTFTPRRYFLTDVNGTKRKINKWKPITIDQYVQQMKDTHKREQNISNGEISLF